MPTTRFGAPYLVGTESVNTSYQKVNQALDALDTAAKPSETTPATYVGRHPLTGMFHVDMYGAVPNVVSTDAFRLALEAADGYNRSNGTYVSGNRGGVVFVPAVSTNAPWLIDGDLITESRVQLIGQNGISAGGRASIIRAVSGGNFNTAGYPDKFMVKLSRQTAVGATNYWGHGAQLVDIQLDCNNVAGLAGYHGVQTGELSLIERVQVVNSGITPRTVNDAVFNGTLTVTSATAAFTQDDVAAEVFSTSFPTYVDRSASMTSTVGSTTVTGTGFTSAEVGAALLNVPGLYNSTYIVSVNSATSITVSQPSLSSGTGTGTITTPRNFRIARVISSTTVELSRPVPSVATGSARNFVINRPRPGVQLHGGGATMLIRSLNVSGNSGAGLEIVGGVSANLIESLTGDNNGGALLRITQTATAADTVTYSLIGLKAENNQYGAIDQSSYGDHDPVILIDNCGMVFLNVMGGTVFAGERSSTDVVRVDLPSGGGSGSPSVYINGLEAGNPYNQQFQNLIRDSSTGKSIAAGTITNGKFYPTVQWNKDKYVVDGDIYINGVRVIPGSTSTSTYWTWNFPPDMAVVGGYNYAVQGSMNGGNYGGAYAVGGPQNADWRWWVTVAPGTWRVYTVSDTGPDRGIGQWQLSYDGGTTWNNVGASVDFYSTTTAYNITNSRTIVVPANTYGTAGTAQLRLLMSSKNASSTGYFFFIGLMSWQRTA